MKNLNKSLMLIGLGVGSAMLYQKYNKPIMKEMNKISKQVKKKVDKELDEMI